MKAIVPLVAFTLTAAVAVGQGTVNFANHVPYVIPAVDAPFFDERGVRLEGPNYVAQLSAWHSGYGFEPVGVPVPFAKDGYFDGRQVRVPFVPLGGSAWARVRAWQVAGGATFEQAALAGAWTGLSGVLFIRYTGNAAGTPPTLPAALIGLEYPGIPLVVRQPQDQTVRVRQPATLSVVASSGVQMSYQWYQNPNDRPDGLIAGATNASYTTPPLSTGTTFWVTVTNSAGSVTSERATITVLPSAPALTIQELSGRPVLTLDGVVGATYRIEYTPSLGATNWTALVDLTLSSNSFTFVDAQGADAPTRFYRALVP